jgi:hypothetical protein
MLLLVRNPDMILMKTTSLKKKNHASPLEGPPTPGREQVVIMPVVKTFMETATSATRPTRLT